MDHSIESTIARIQEHAAGTDNDKVANILVDLMPAPGLALVAGEDYQRARLLIGIVTALVAYCDEWESIPEPDVLADVAAYAAMLNTIDGRRRKREKNFIRMTDAADDFTQKWAAGHNLSTEEAIKAANASLGASDALTAWAATEAERIFPTPPVDSTAATDETSRRQGYAPSS